MDEPALRHDCRSMLVDETERFMSQRQLPCTALIKVRIERGSLVVSALGMSFWLCRLAQSPASFSSLGSGTISWRPRRWVKTQTAGSVSF